MRCFNSNKIFCVGVQMLPPAHDGAMHEGLQEGSAGCQVQVFPLFWEVVLTQTQVVLLCEISQGTK